MRANSCPVSLSVIGLDLLKSFEHCRLPAYLPTPHDVLTIGWGATRNADGSAIKPGDRWDQAKCDLRLDADVDTMVAEVTRLVEHASTSQPQFDALVVLAYNIGSGALAGSTLLRAHIAGHFSKAADAFAEWRTQHGRVLPGLVRRRAAEAARYRQAG